jgi:hypothetical protein
LAKEARRKARVSDQERIHVRYQWTADAYAAAHKLYMRLPGPRAWVWFSCLFFAATAYLAYVVGSDPHTDTVTRILCPVLFILMGAIRWSTEGLATSEVSWNLICKALVAPRGTLLFLTPRQYVYLPAAGVATDEERRRLATLVAASVPNTKTLR